MVDVSADRFAELVADALDGIPEDLGRLMDNVNIFVDDHSPPGRLFGYYEGIPLTRREAYGGMAMPDKITIYRQTICAACRSEDEVVEQVQVTVVHEVAHHFGISDARLTELGWGVTAVTIEWPTEVDAGDGVVLRAPDPADAEGMVEAITASLDELRPWMAWAAEPMTVDQQAVRMALGSEQFTLGADAHYTIVVDGEIAGSIGMHDRLGDPAAREIGYWRRTGFGRRGVVTRAVAAVVDVLAEQGFERVEIHCDAGNAPSAAVAERAGFTLLRIEDDATREAPASTMRTMVWERRLTP